MYAHRAGGAGGSGKDAYDVIDIDPYGTAAPFLDSAVQAIADGGLLCITSTDMPVLGGNYPEACFGRYGGSALKAGYLHEMSLRLLVHAVSTSAARYGREVRPLLCCSVDFYVRIFVQVFTSPSRAKFAASKSGIVHQCVQCDSFFIQPLGEAAAEQKGHVKFRPARVVVPGQECPECGAQHQIGGPFYTGPLYDQDFVKSCIRTCEEDPQRLTGITMWKKIRGLLVAISEEHADLPLHYIAQNLCSKMKLPQLPLRQFKGTLIALGYRASHFHREPEAVKTDAPNAVVYDLMRRWAKEHPPQKNPLPQILLNPMTVAESFRWEVEVKAVGPKTPKFLPNPEANWGPKSRATGKHPHRSKAEEETGADSAAGCWNGIET